MKEFRKVILCMVSIFALFTTNIVATVDYGDIPAQELPPNGWQDTQWDDPGNWTTVNVSDHGLAADDKAIDTAEKVRQIIAQGSGNRIIYFPEGTYYLKTRLVITDGNIILKGDGIEATQLVIDTPASELGTIMFTSDEDFDATLGTTVALQQSVALGDTAITLTDTGSLNAGDCLYLYLQNGLEHWGTYTEAQIVEVTGINGNEVTLDMAVGLEMDIAKTPVIQKLDMIENVGVQDLLIHRTRAADADSPSNLEFKLVRNAFVKDIESSYSERSHIITRFSKNVIVERNYVHHSYDYGGGGQGYGIEFSSASTGCRATDNKLWTLRHHLMAHLGANHNVFSYNSLEGDYNGTSNPANLHGDYAHNNLFESNWFAKNGLSDGYWGADGPRNTWFRNYSGGTIGTYDARYGDDTVDQVIVGNVMDSIALDNSTDYVAMNRINGTITPGSLTNEPDVPNSLYLSAQPTFFGTESWPLFGPSVGQWGDANTLPAYDRTKTDGYNPVPAQDVPGVQLFEDTFDSEPTGVVPTGWSVNETYGDARVAELPSASDKSIKVNDTSGSGSISVAKSFEAQESTMELSFDMMMPSTVDYFNVQLREDGTGTSAVAIFTKAGNLTYRDSSNGYKTLQAYSANTWYSIKVVADAQADLCDIYVNDVLKASQVGFRNAVTAVDTVQAGSPGSNQGIMYVDNVTVVGASVPSSIYAEDFNLETTGQVPTDWIADQTNGTVAAAEIPSSSDKSMEVVDTSSSGGVTSKKIIDNQQGVIDLSFDMMLPSPVDYFNIQLRDDGTSTSAVAIFTKAGNLTYRDSSNGYVTLQSYSANTWYTIRIVADVQTDLCDIYVNGTMKASQVGFRNVVSSFNAVQVGSPGSNQGTIYIDNVLISAQ